MAGKTAPTQVSVILGQWMVKDMLLLKSHKRILKSRCSYSSEEKLLLCFSKCLAGVTKAYRMFDASALLSSSWTLILVHTYPPPQLEKTPLVSRSFCLEILWFFFLHHNTWYLCSVILPIHAWHIFCSLQRKAPSTDWQVGRLTFHCGN